MAKHSVQRKRKKTSNGFSFGSAVVLVLCFIGVSFGLYLWQAAFSIGQTTPTMMIFVRPSVSHRTVL